MNTKIKKSNLIRENGKLDVELLKTWAFALAVPAAFGGVSFWLFREHGRSKAGR